MQSLNEFLVKKHQSSSILTDNKFINSLSKYIIAVNLYEYKSGNLIETYILDTDNNLEKLVGTDYDKGEDWGDFYDMYVVDDYEMKFERNNGLTLNDFDMLKRKDFDCDVRLEFVLKSKLIEKINNNPDIKIYDYL